MAKQTPKKSATKKPTAAKATRKKPAAKKVSAAKPPAKKKATAKAPAKKKTTAKAPAVKKKTAPKKATAKKKAPAVKKAPVKKAPAKKVPVKKAPVKKVPTKKAPAKKLSSKTTTKEVTKAKKNPTAEPVKKKGKKTVKTGTSMATVKKKLSSSSRKSATGTTETVGRSTTARKKTRGKAGRRTAAFTLADVQEIAKTNALEAEKNAPSTEATKAAAARKAAELAEVQQEKRVHAAASLADILGFNPTSSSPREDEEKAIPKKHIRYYRLLMELRDHVSSEINLHTEDTLKRSSKDESGDLSSYSQHIADAGTDTFDRDFALSLVSNEQEALFEIEEALKRIKTGSYGVCELTGKPISKERLLAVPFARYSVESQTQVEKTTRKSVQRGGIFADANPADAAAFIQDDSDD